MKRSKQSVPSTETGAIRGDGTGNSNMTMPTKSGRNATTNESRRGAGQLAPRPQTSKSQYMSQSSVTAPSQAGIARVPNAPSSATGKMPTAGSFTPVGNNALANLTGQRTGQAEVNPRGSSGRISPKTLTPTTGNPVASTKPKRKGLGSAFFGEYS
jgi:hypothetical protein